MKKKSDPERTTPIGTVRYACEFLQAALIVDNQLGAGAAHAVVAPVPAMFLVGQSIELSLKAFLLDRGATLEFVQYTVGHDLIKALQHATERGLRNEVDLDDEDLQALEVLNALYKSKQLQYIVTGEKDFPPFGPLERVARQLAHAVSALVGFRPKGLPEPQARAPVVDHSLEAAVQAISKLLD